MMQYRWFLGVSLVMSTLAPAGNHVAAVEPAQPIPVIFDTDIGNDIDDALALGVIHALQSRGECRLVAVTISKDNALCAPLSIWSTPSMAAAISPSGWCGTAKLRRKASTCAPR